MILGVLVASHSDRSLKKVTLWPPNEIETKSSIITLFLVFSCADRPVQYLTLWPPNLDKVDDIGGKSR